VPKGVVGTFHRFVSEAQVLQQRDQVPVGCLPGLAHTRSLVVRLTCLRQQTFELALVENSVVNQMPAHRNNVGGPGVQVEIAIGQ
jgi:hypothetical protein